ncbi:class I SAM-dependent methyltransferase [Rathayibacter sp. SD072]|uniref:class I SAM-dependent methyltransferase n=1 Tax=Rathayibacter sp. SD072 TaxID=2781731 RepID=UPI001A96F54D|nr:class I SAM-dependent methyltransferase [Rathayibacter sp. SD072]MBO0983616.1 class I SAM-dependent methyltransferase [Rathayibacter sp. SD072]
MTGAPGASGILAELRISALVTAALASTLSDERAATPAEALALDPARAAVLDALPDAESALTELWEGRRARSGSLVSGLSQAAAAAGGTVRAWSDLGDDVMIAQGRSSALMARVLLESVAPAYGVATPTRVLDVGTGIGAIATALAEGMPSADVVGIDIAERPLGIARALLAEADPHVGDRVLLRREDVTELSDHSAYDLVWMPLPFLPDAIVDRALDRAVAALRPGGLLVLGTLPPVADERLRAADAWLATLTGGGTLTRDEVVERLSTRGLERIRSFDTVPGAPVLVAAVVPR